MLGIIFRTVLVRSCSRCQGMFDSSECLQAQTQDKDHSEMQARMQARTQARTQARMHARTSSEWYGMNVLQCVDVGSDESSVPMHTCKLNVMKIDLYMLTHSHFLSDTETLRFSLFSCALRHVIRMVDVLPRPVHGQFPVGEKRIVGITLCKNMPADTCRPGP